jgi:ectoine hydroxylase-related dioxygenase (phytanoyl-CoA dioxygenase family)
MENRLIQHGHQVRQSGTVQDLRAFTMSSARAVPGSHRCGQSAREMLADPAAAHPGEVRLIAPAGTVVVFNSHLWHGGTQNHAGQPRRALHSYFTRRANRQQLDQQKYLRPETLAALTPAARFILDV